VPDDQPEIRWDKNGSPAWRSKVNSWEWRRLDGKDWEKSGTCPRCDHEMAVRKQGAASTVAISEEALMAIMLSAEDAPLFTKSDEGVQFFARCDCAEKHPGRPASLLRGCGQWAEIDAPPDA
jgi:hypothetical protein